MGLFAHRHRGVEKLRMRLDLVGVRDEGDERFRRRDVGHTAEPRADRLRQLARVDE